MSEEPISSKFVLVLLQTHHQHLGMRRPSTATPRSSDATKHRPRNPYMAALQAHNQLHQHGTYYAQAGARAGFLRGASNNKQHVLHSPLLRQRMLVDLVVRYINLRQMQQHSHAVVCVNRGLMDYVESEVIQTTTLTHHRTLYLEVVGDQPGAWPLFLQCHGTTAPVSLVETGVVGRRNLDENTASDQSLPGPVEPCPGLIACSSRPRRKRRRGCSSNNMRGFPVLHIAWPILPSSAYTIYVPPLIGGDEPLCHR